MGGEWWACVCLIVFVHPTHHDVRLCGRVVVYLGFILFEREERGGEREKYTTPVTLWRRGFCMFMGLDLC